MKDHSRGRGKRGTAYRTPSMFRANRPWSPEHRNALKDNPLSRRSHQNQKAEKA